MVNKMYVQRFVEGVPGDQLTSLSKMQGEQYNNRFIKNLHWAGAVCWGKPFLSV